MATISVVLATYNEEKNLPACLDSVEDLADEIVVVDGWSKDRTVQIAKKYGAKVKITNNPLIFHINKQKAIDMAAKNWFLGKFLMKGGQYPDYTLRLYKRGKGKLPQKTVHEQAVVDGEVEYLKNPLLHYPYKNFGMYLEKWNRYTDLIATQIKDQLREKNLATKIFYMMDFIFIKPIFWFANTYIRHKGFYDLWPGFVFSFFSSLRFPVGYLKYLGKSIKK